MAIAVVSCRPRIAMMQTTNLWDRIGLTALWRFHRPLDRRVVLEGLVRPRFVVVLEIRGPNSMQMRLVQNNGMVETRSPVEPMGLSTYGF